MVGNKNTRLEIDVVVVCAYNVQLYYTGAAAGVSTFLRLGLGAPLREEESSAAARLEEEESHSCSPSPSEEEESILDWAASYNLIRSFNSKHSLQHGSV